MADRDRNVDRMSDDLSRIDDNTTRAANQRLSSDDDTATPEKLVGETVGGVGGMAAGAAIGSLAGPVGTVIGALAGVVGGWWAGRSVADAASTYSDDDDQYYRRHFESSSMTDSGLGAATTSASTSSSASSLNQDYDTYRPAYQLGQVASRNPDYADRDFEAVETDLRRGWTDDVSSRYGSWDTVRDRARQGFERGREQRLTLSEEQLSVGTRQVEAGEAAVRKTVETEHVRKTVPVQREEVVVERRPISGDRTDDVDIREDEIRVPLMAEEVVVEKRAVPTEELVIQKRVVTEQREVEADLRKERVDDSQLRNTTSRTADRVAGSAESEIDRGGNAIERGARKVADKLDDVKDRVDGNPASRPGPDATDRR
jgi:uncharacterized protein (TIGR02271 family)